MKRSLLAEIERMAESADEEQLLVLERMLEGDSRIGAKRAIDKARRRLSAEKAETERLESLYSYPLEAVSSIAPHATLDTVLGLDEVGRGSLAGPLAVGAVVLRGECDRISGLNDSKAVTPERRESLAKRIKERACVTHVEFVSPSDIDSLGIMDALRTAFRNSISAVEDSGVKVDAILLDGNPLGIDPREVNVVKGDARCAPVAAASIIAKVERDRLMERLSRDYPQYGFESNKGYGTDFHRQAIRDHGMSDMHRRSFCTEFLQESLF